MITPILIQILFWLATLGCIVMGIRTIIASLDVAKAPPLSFDVDVPRLSSTRSSGFSPLLFAIGIAWLTIGPLVLRVVCELVMILFKIHDELKETNNRGRYHDRD